MAGEAANAPGLEGNNTVLGGMNGVIIAQCSTFAGSLRQTDLTNDNLAGLDLLAGIQLHAKALARTIMDVFGGTAGFYM